MASIHVKRGIEFRTDLYGKAPAQMEAWFRAMGEQLRAQKLSVRVGTSLTISNGDEAVALYQRYLKDKKALAAELGLPPTTTLANYFSDLVQALDDSVKASSEIQDRMVDLRPTSELGKLLGLDTAATYLSKKSPFGQQGPDAVARVDAVAVIKQADPLRGQPFIDQTTFANLRRSFSTRDGVELEQVYGVTGVSGHDLLKALRTKNSNGRTAFERLRKPEQMEAFSNGIAGVGLDDMRWDAEAHRMRESSKLVSLVLESERFEKDAESGVREISLGTDKMDDTYYDTPEFLVHGQESIIRGRVRWDNDQTVRRILVGTKAQTKIDEFGLKRTTKLDVRNDSASADDVANLDRDIRVGRTSWHGALSPMKDIYDGLLQAGKLKNVGPHQGVLQLEPKLYLRSVRSRYHLNETSINALQNFYKQTSGKLDAVIALMEAAKPKLTGADLQTITELETAAGALKSGATVAALAEPKLKQVDPAMAVTADTIKELMPSTAVNWNSVKNTEDSLEKKRIVAEAIDQAYHQFAQQLDQARRALCMAEDRSLEEYPQLFRDWARSTDASLKEKNTYEPFLAQYERLAEKTPADRAADLKAFNDFGAARKAEGDRDYRDFQPLDEARFAALRPQLLNEVVRINQRQLEAAGTTARQLWFDEARQFFVPKSYRSTSNFIIDTMDMTEYLSAQAWSSIAPELRTPAHPLPEDKIFHATLVNETQIELGSEEPFLNRMTELAESIHQDQVSLVMKYLDASNAQGLDRTNAETYIQAAKSIEVDRLNAFLVTQGSGLAPLTAQELAGLNPSLFTLDIRDRPVRTDKSTEQMLEGAKMVFNAYIEVQKTIVKSKEAKVRNVLERAGLSNFQWAQFEKSKGQIGLEMLQAGAK